MEPGAAGHLFPRQQLRAGGGQFFSGADLACHAVEPRPSSFLLDNGHYDLDHITIMECRRKIENQHKPTYLSKEVS